MRGFNQQKRVNTQESLLDKNIEDYTIKDCEDFLVKYPNDLDADQVRKRLKELSPNSNCGKRSNKTSDTTDSANSEVNKGATRTEPRSQELIIEESPTKPDFFETVIGKIVLSILLILGILALACILAAIGFPKMSWLPALGVVGLGNIWK